MPTWTRSSSSPTRRGEIAAVRDRAAAATSPWSGRSTAIRSRPRRARRGLAGDRHADRSPSRCGGLGRRGVSAGRDRARDLLDPARSLEALAGAWPAPCRSARPASGAAGLTGPDSPHDAPRRDPRAARGRAAVPGARAGGRRAIAAAPSGARGRPRRHRRPRHERPRGDLRPVRARRPARAVGRARDAVGLSRCTARSRGSIGRSSSGSASRARRRTSSGHRGRPPPGRADARDHERPRRRRWPRGRDVIDLGAGPELAVAATKTYTTELLAIAALSAACPATPRRRGGARRRPGRGGRGARAEPEVESMARRPGRGGIGCWSWRAATSTRRPASGRSSSRSWRTSSPTRTPRPTSSTGRWRCWSRASRCSRRSARADGRGAGRVARAAARDVGGVAGRVGRRTRAGPARVAVRAPAGRRNGSGRSCRSWPGSSTRST